MATVFLFEHQILSPRNAANNVFTTSHSPIFCELASANCWTVHVGRLGSTGTAHAGPTRTAYITMHTRRVLAKQLSVEYGLGVHGHPSLPVIGFSPSLPVEVVLPSSLWAFSPPPLWLVLLPSLPVLDLLPIHQCPDQWQKSEGPHQEDCHLPKRARGDAADLLLRLGG